MQDNSPTAVKHSFSTYLQLPSISGGRPLHQQSKNAPYQGDKGPIATGKFYTCL